MVFFYKFHGQFYENLMTGFFCNFPPANIQWTPDFWIVRFGTIRPSASFVHRNIYVRDHGGRSMLTATTRHIAPVNCCKMGAMERIINCPCGTWTVVGFWYHFSLSASSIWGWVLSTNRNVLSLQVQKQMATMTWSTTTARCYRIE